LHANTSYKYYLRPGYGSEKLLIEFISGVESDTFINDLFDAIKNIKPEIIDLADLWMNDEVLYSINSTLGEFTLSKDIWDLAFIMSEDNQTYIAKINELLIADNRFEKIEIDFNNYKTVKS
jgi:hypothetical protein